MARLTISFKGTEDDEELYEALRIVSHGNFSAYAKTVFRDLLDIPAILEAHASKTGSTRVTVTKTVNSSKIQENIKANVNKQTHTPKEDQTVYDDIDDDLEELPDLPDKKAENQDNNHTISSTQTSSTQTKGSASGNGMIGGMDIGMVTKMNFGK